MNEGPFDLREQERAEAERATREEYDRLDRVNEIKWIMGNEIGRRFMWRILEQAGVFRSTFSNDALTMAFAEGNRNEGLRQLAMIHEVCPEMYPVMLKESTSARRNHTDDDPTGSNDASLV